MDMCKETIETPWNLAVPFTPVVAAWLSVEFVGAVVQLQKRDESADWGEKRFLLSC